MRFPRFLLCSLLVLAVLALADARNTYNNKDEWVLLVGGPSMHQWEQYKAQPHDHWWANFEHAARLRTDELRQQLGPEAKITWLVYKQADMDRATQEKAELLSHIESVRDKYNLKLVWF